MDNKELTKFISFQEKITSMIKSFLEFLIEQHTTLELEKEVVIRVETNDVYIDLPRYITLVIDQPNMSLVQIADPNAAGALKYQSGIHTFMVTGNFTVHVVSKNEPTAQRLSSLIFLISLTQQAGFMKHGFNELVPVSIGSTIVINPEEMQEAWFDVPVTFQYTTTMGAIIEEQLGNINKVKFNILDGENTILSQIDLNI